MDNFEHLCPVCINDGKTTFLQLRQINLTTAVYMCTDSKCIYPEGHSWIFKERNFFDNLKSCTDSSEDEDDSQSVTRSENSNHVNQIIVCDKIKEELEIKTEIPIKKLDSQMTNLQSNLEINNISETVESQIGQLNLQQAKFLVVDLKSKKMQKASPEMISKIKFIKSPIKSTAVRNLNDYNLKIIPVEPTIVENKIELNQEKLNNVVRSKIRVKCKREKVTGTSLPNSIIKAAELLPKVEKPKPVIGSKLKKNFIDSIFGKNTSTSKLQKSASCFEGFKYSTQNVKMKNNALKVNKIKNEIKSEIEVTEEKILAKNEITDDVSNKTENNEIVNNVDVSLNDFFDNIDNFKMTNVPENDANIAEVDEWLSSLCQ